MRAERQFYVPPLSLPDPTYLPQLQELSQYPALALFVERAQAIQPDFSLTEANANTVARLCQRLDGLPLAIELIAARVRLLSPAEILRRLGGRFLLQSGGLRDIDERQRTLKNAIDQASARRRARLSVARLCARKGRVLGRHSGLLAE